MLDWNNDIILYHGSNSIVNNIDINKTRKESDFGQGFYLTSSIIQAKKWAIKKSKLNKNNPIVNLFEYNIINDLEIKEFRFPDIDWLNYILYNRLKNNSIECDIEKYDLIIGPVADDNTIQVINLYTQGIYGDINLNKTKNIVINLLENVNLTNQYCFKTNKSISYLDFIRSENIEY